MDTIKLCTLIYVAIICIKAIELSFWLVLPLLYSLAARGGNLAKIPPNQVIADFGRGSSVESESE